MPRMSRCLILFLLVPSSAWTWPIQRLSTCELRAPNTYWCAPLPPDVPSSTGLSLVPTETNTGPVTLQVGDGPVRAVLRLVDGAGGTPPTCALTDLAPGTFGPGPIQILETAGEAWVWCTTQSACFCPKKKDPPAPVR